MPERERIVQCDGFQRHLLGTGEQLGVVARLVKLVEERGRKIRVRGRKTRVGRNRKIQILRLLLPTFAASVERRTLRLHIPIVRQQAWRRTPARGDGETTVRQSTGRTGTRWHSIRRATFSSRSGT